MNDPKVLLEWLEPLRRWRKNTIRIVEESPSAVRAVVYTAEHSYRIDAAANPDREHGYLGCIASCRAPRPGEDWTRGNDLSDGSLTRETFQSIMADIVAYELQELALPRNELAALGIGTPDTPAA